MAKAADCRFCGRINVGSHKCKALPEWYGNVTDDGSLDYNLWTDTRPNPDTERSDTDRRNYRRSREQYDQENIARLMRLTRRR